MNLPDNPDNNKYTHQNKPEERHATPVANGKVRNNLGKYLMKTFIMEDPKDVAWEVLDKEIVPGIKNAAFNAAQMFIYGIGGSPRKGATGSSIKIGSKVDFHGISNGKTTVASEPKRDRSTITSRDAREFDDFIFDELKEAKDVLQDLFDEACTYDKVNVRYYYELAGHTEGIPYTADYYGWYKEDLEGVKVVPVRGGGYYISLPRPVALNKG